MDTPTLIGAALGLLFLGSLVMTQMPKEWQTIGGWLLVSLAGIPLFGIVLAVLIKVPLLLFGAVAWACFHAGRSSRR